MRHWRLHIQGDHGFNQEFDLRHQSRVVVGDDTSADVCLTSISVPSELRMVSRGRKGPELKLTDEILETFKGEYEAVKTWKTPLYKGVVYRALGNCSWKVGTNVFELREHEDLVLSPSLNSEDPLAKKHALQSAGHSAALHVLLFLLVVGLHFAYKYFNPDNSWMDAQKLSIVKVDELFKPKTIPQVAVAESVPAVEVAQPEKIEKIETQDNKDAAVKAGGGAKASPKLKVVKHAKSNRAATAQGTGIKKQDVGSMGLLALQTAKSTNTDRKLSLDENKIYNPVQKGSGTGVSLDPKGLGIRAGDGPTQVATLSDFSGGEYQNGAIGRQLGSGSGGNGVGAGPAIRLVRKEIEIRGGLDPAIIQQIIEERLAEVRHCYETALIKDVKLGGKIATSWTITKDGTVRDLVSSSDDIQRSDLHDCLKQRIGKWKFPEPKGGGIVRVKYPFVFSSLGS